MILHIKFLGAHILWYWPYNFTSEYDFDMEINIYIYMLTEQSILNSSLQNFFFYIYIYTKSYLYINFKLLLSKHPIKIIEWINLL